MGMGRLRGDPLCPITGLLILSSLSNNGIYTCLILWRMGDRHQVPDEPLREFFEGMMENPILAPMLMGTHFSVKSLFKIPL